MTVVGDQEKETLKQHGETLQGKVTQGDTVGVNVFNIKVFRMPSMVPLKKMRHQMVVIILPQQVPWSWPDDISGLCSQPYP